MSTANSVIGPIERGWDELNGLIDSLGPHGLTLSGPDGWAVKDHLVHIAAWELSLLGLLEGADRRSAMGVPGADEETDSINAAVWALHRGMTPEQALDHFRETHAMLTRRLGTLSDADLQRPYNHFQPHDPRDQKDNRPVLDWVGGNTWEHYAEHTDYINQIVKDSSAAR